MASHYRLLKYQIWNNQALSGTSTVNSSPVSILMLDNIGLQLNVSGTSNGTFTVQISIDYAKDAEGNVTNAGHWISLGVTQVLTSGSPNEIYFDLNQLSATWVRVSYTNTSGSGNVTGFASGKGLI